MGQSTDALLVYGYNLGGPPEEWYVQETGSYGLLDVPWWDQEQDDPTFTEAAATRLREADVHGVTLHVHCTRDYPEYLLAAHAVKAHRGYPQTLDLDDLLRSQLTSDGWQSQLSAALTALGLTPTQDAPGWLLAVYAEL
ncbi:hypothetical protein [Streptomyces sp. NPDC088847]|uniref:hypothetical protein n=1 Tax=Streptomyces sp. NPDC088847 TaxID=3365909 RepID=UPI00381AEA6B